MNSRNLQKKPEARWISIRSPLLSAAMCSTWHKHLLSRSNQFGDTVELGPAEAGSGQSAVTSPSIMLEIEALIADEPPLEGNAARRFPATPLNSAELSLGHQLQSGGPQNL